MFGPPEDWDLKSRRNMEPPQKKRKSTPADNIEPLTDELVRRPTPVLRLRPTMPAELRNLTCTEGIKGPDGPLVPHPGLIRDREFEPERYSTGLFPLDISMDEYRQRWRAAMDKFHAMRTTCDQLDILWVMHIHPRVDMERTDGRTDEDIALAVERTYPGALWFVMLCS
jgi:hypothetical protein